MQPMTQSADTVSTSSTLDPSPSTPATPSEAPTPITDMDAFDSGVFVAINHESLFSLDGIGGVANGNAAITFPDRRFAGALTPEGEVESFSCGIALRGALTLELRIDAAGAIAGSIPLPVFVLPPLVFGNVVATPYVSPRIKYSGALEASGRASFVAPFAADVEFIGQRNPTMAILELVPEMGAPEAALDIELSLELELSLAFMVTIQGVPIGGPALTLSLLFAVHVTALPAAQWYADLTTELSGGLDDCARQPRDRHADPTRTRLPTSWRWRTGCWPSAIQPRSTTLGLPEGTSSGPCARAWMACSTFQAIAECRFGTIAHAGSGHRASLAC